MTVRTEREISVHYRKIFTFLSRNLVIVDKRSLDCGHKEMCVLVNECPVAARIG